MQERFQLPLRADNVGLRAALVREHQLAGNGGQRQLMSVMQGNDPYFHRCEKAPDPTQDLLKRFGALQRGVRVFVARTEKRLPSLYSGIDRLSLPFLQGVNAVIARDGIQPG